MPDTIINTIIKISRTDRVRDVWIIEFVDWVIEFVTNLTYMMPDAIIEISRI